MSKQLNKQLCLIIGQAYETELERELDALEAEFRRWRSQEIDAFELEARIHRFHNGPARKLWSTYVEGPTSMLSFNVAGAIVRGVVPREDDRRRCCGSSNRRSRAFDGSQGTAPRRRTTG